MARGPCLTVPCAPEASVMGRCTTRGAFMRYRSLLTLVLALSVALLLVPGIAYADGGSGGPYYLGIGTTDRYVRGGEVLQEEDFTEGFRPRPGDQVFFNERLYHSTRNGARGTRAGRLTVHCTVGIRFQFLCDATMYIRGEGQLYLRTTTPGADRFLAAVIGGTRSFKAARGDVVVTERPRGRSLYQLRLR